MVACIEQACWVDYPGEKEGRKTRSGNHKNVADTPFKLIDWLQADNER